MHAYKKSQKVWAEIDLAALRENYRKLTATVNAAAPGCRTIAVVKANAYGHGVDIVSRTLLSEGCDFFAVSCIYEANELRDAVGDAPDILILGYTLASDVELLLSQNIIQTVYSEEYAVALSEKIGSLVASGHLPPDTRLPIHLKLDTGMNRLGFDATDPEAAVAALMRVMALPHLTATGMFTHFATADTDGGDCGLTARQLDRFEAVEAALKAKGICPPFLHTCNSAASLTLPRGYKSGVRAGNILYGMSPFGKVLPGFAPVMTLKARVAHIHTLKPGESVSYGATFTATEDIRIATVPVGYGDGFLRHFGGASMRLSDGTLAPIVGRICMDQCMIAIGDAPVTPGDTVTVFGGDDGSMLEALSQIGDTINYEIPTLLTPRIPRVPVNG